nr:MAG TPA: hypothetical protein [Caudoviricetes sp.]
MPASQFWDGDPWLAAAYRKAHEYKSQMKSEEMWLQGVYFFNAVSISLGNAFRKKGAKPQNYMEQPIRLLPMTEEEKAEKAKQERQKAVDYLNRFLKQWKTK